MIPRFQGNAIQDEKGWYWELFVSNFGGGQEAEMFSTNDRFKTKDDALSDLYTVIQNCIDTMSKNHPELNIESGTMIDLKTNQKLLKNTDKRN